VLIQGIDMIRRRTLLKTIALTPLLKWSTALSNEENSNNVHVSSLDELRKTIPFKEGELITLTSLSPNNPKGGGIFIAINNNKNLPDDNGSFINTSCTLSWKRLECIRKTKKPEWYGCLGDGISDDSIPFKNMLNSLQDGDSIILSKDSNYFNNLPTQDSRWIVNKNNITIIGNNAVLSRRGTSLHTKSLDGANLATLKISNVNNFRIKGKLLITANETNMPLVDKKNNIVSRKTYPRAYVSSHGLFLEKVKEAYLPETLTCSNAVFPCYILECENIDIAGKYNNSGQVYPVSGADLQLGSGIKVAKTNNFSINITSADCAYCGCEIEPYSTNGNVNVIASNSYQHGCIIHRDGYNIKINLLAENALGAGLKISAGSKNINGIIHSNKCMYGCIIISEHSDICEDLNIKLYTRDIIKSDLVAKNVNENYPSMRNAVFSITNASSNENPNLLENNMMSEKAPSSQLGEIDNAQNCNISWSSLKQNKDILIKNSSNCTITLVDAKKIKYKILEKNNTGTNIEYK